MQRAELEEGCQWRDLAGWQGYRVRVWLDDRAGVCEGVLLRSVDGASHLFTNSTEAEVRLDYNDGGLWRSKEGETVAYSPVDRPHWVGHRS